MSKLVRLLLKIALIGCAGPIFAQTTVYTGTIKDLSGAVVTSGQVTYTLTPSTDSTIPGVGRFTPTTVTCPINSDGTLSSTSGGACTVASNTTLSPTGTSYRICIQPYYATPGSCFYDYAVTASKDISTVAPTLSTGPINYNGVPGVPGPVGPPGPSGGSLSYPGVTSDGINGLNITGIVTGGTQTQFPTYPLSGNEYAFGDSQTYGVNNANPQPFYTDGSGRILPQYRWTDLFAAMDGRSLTVNNYAVGGTKISWTPGGVSDQSIFNTTGNLASNWQGVAVVMAGWNNIDATTVGSGFFAVMQQAHQAMIARLLIDDYAGIGVTGCNHDGTICPFLGWSTTGTDDHENVPAGQGRNYMPFYYGNASAPRIRTALTGTQNVQFSLPGSKKAIGIFYETSTDGGPFTVSINGTTVATGNSLYIPAGGNDAGQYPGVLWIEAPPATAAVTVTANVGSGHLYFMAFGWINPTGSLISSKTIVYGTVSGNQAISRAPATLFSAAKGAAQAVAEFNAYPVYLSDNISDWVEGTDQEPTDLSHFTDVGNQHIATSFRAASKTMGNQFYFRSSFLPPYNISNASWATWFFRSQGSQGRIPLARFINDQANATYWDAFDLLNHQIGSAGRYLSGMYFASAAPGGALYLQPSGAQFVGIGNLVGAPVRLLEIAGTTPFLVRIGDGLGTNEYDFGRDTSTGLLTFYGRQTGFNGVKFTGVDGDWFTASAAGLAAPGITVTPAGAEVLGTSVQLQPHVVGTCNAGAAGTFAYTQGNSTTKDNVQVCAHDATNTYAWRTIY